MTAACAGAATAAAVEADPEQALWLAHAACPGPATREQLVLRYLPLARGIAWHTVRRHGIRGVDMEDVMQAACEGLIQSVDRFRPEQGHRFNAFAGFRIEGAVLNSLATLSEVQQQIAARLRVRRDRARSLRPEPRSTPTGAEAALEALASVSVGLALGFMLEGSGVYEDPEAPPRTACGGYESLAWRQAQDALRGLVRELRPDERRVLEYHYYQGLSFAQIAAMLELTPGRISQLHRQALGRLQQALARCPAFAH